MNSASLLPFFLLAATALPMPGKAPDAAARELEAIPSLRKWHAEEGFTSIGTGSRIVIARSDLAGVAESIARDLVALGQSAPGIVSGEGRPGDIELTLDPALGRLGGEGYQIVAADHVVISAAELSGLRCGSRTLLQVLRQGQGFPRGTGVDYPKYRSRGLTLDVSRKFYTIDYLRRLVRELAWFKLNVLHLHLTDDQAFRLESESYPGLAAADGHYTKREMRELIELGAAHGVTVIPELNGPGHVGAILRYRPELGAQGAFDLRNPGGMALMKKLWSEYLDPRNPTFTGPVVHMGTDEVEVHGQEDRELLRGWLNEISAHIRSHGKEVRAWGGLDRYTGETPVDPRIQMDLWNWGWGNAATALPAGHALANIDDARLYIVPYSGIYRDYLDTRDLYLTWEPNQFPGGVTLPADHPQMSGANFAIWNDRSPSYGISMDDTTERILAALPVFSEKCWHGTAAAPDHEAFLQREKKVKSDPQANLRYAVSTVAADAAVLRYRFDGNLDDHSGNRRDGMAHNAGYAPGEIGEALYLKGGESYVETPLSAIGFGYSISFTIKPEPGNPADAVILESPQGKLMLNCGGSGKLGFAKEDYVTTFDHVVPEGEWTDITLTGDAEGTCLHVNGDEQVERLIHQIRLNTFVLPLARIGSATHSFRGAIDNLVVLDHAVDPVGVRRNLALGKRATASSWELNRSDLAPNKAVDGDLSTRWSTAAITDGWLVLDLGAIETLDRAVIHWEIQRGARYRLLVSEDGQAWQNVLPDEGEFTVERRFDPLSFPPCRARYVKLQGTKLSNWGYAIHEMELYGAGQKLDAAYRDEIAAARRMLSDGKSDPRAESLVVDYPLGRSGSQ